MNIGTSPDMGVIGSNIKFLRLLHHFTQQDIADLLGISKGSVSRVENGLHLMSFERACILANKFGVSPDLFFSLEQEKLYEKVNQRPTVKTASNLDFASIFAENFKKARLAKQLSQRDLAAKLDVSFTSISRYECGDMYPEFAKLPQIAEGLGVSMQALFEISLEQPHADELIVQNAENTEENTPKGASRGKREQFTKREPPLRQIVREQSLAIEQLTATITSLNQVIQAQAKLISGSGTYPDL